MIKWLTILLLMVLPVLLSAEASASGDKLGITNIAGDTDGRFYSPTVANSDSSGRLGVFSALQSTLPFIPGGGGTVFIVVEKIVNVTTGIEEEKIIGKVVNLEDLEIKWKIPYVPSLDKETVILSFENKTIDSRLIVTGDVAPYLQVASCSTEYALCAKDEINLKPGQKKSIYAEAAWNKTASETLLKKQWLEGFINIEDEDTVYRIRVVVEPALLYSQINHASRYMEEKHIPVKEKYTAIAIYSLLGLASLVVLRLLLRGAFGT